MRTVWSSIDVMTGSASVLPSGDRMYLGTTSRFCHFALATSTLISLGPLPIPAHVVCLTRKMCPGTPDNDAAITDKRTPDHSEIAQDQPDEVDGEPEDGRGEHAEQYLGRGEKRRHRLCTIASVLGAVRRTI